MIVMEIENEPLSSLSFASSSFTSNDASNHCKPADVCDSGANFELLSLSRLSGSLEKLLLDSDYDYSDAEIVVEGTSIGVNRCILACRSQFFHDLFKTGNTRSRDEGKPKYFMKDFVPYGKIGCETFMVFLNYLYTGKLKPSPPEVSTCVDQSCDHHACGPAINYAVELMYASAIFQMKDLVMLVQRRIINFVDKAFVEDMTPIVLVAFHCQLNQLLGHCIRKLAHSDLDDLTLDKDIPDEVLVEIKSLRDTEYLEHDISKLDFMYDKSITRIHKALDSDDIELLQLLLDESGITLDDTCALHYASSYCNPKVVRELISTGNADLNHRNCRGHTVLHVAARRKDPSIIVGLLSNGASVLETTSDGRNAITICRRLTRPKDYYETTKHGEETNKDRICIDVLEREMLRNPLVGNVSTSSMMVADDLLMRLLLMENRVALARVLYPGEAKLAMQIANTDSTSEFAGISGSKSSCVNLREVDLNEIPSEQVNRLQLRLQALQRTAETGKRFFPHCADVLDKFLEDEMHEALLMENDSQELQNGKKMRYMELKDEVMKAFDKDKAENKWGSFLTYSSSSTSSKPSKHKGRKRPLH